MRLLFSDCHLDDQPVNEYRWRVFDHVHALLDAYPITHINNLGDFIDRKDRFTSIFVNRLIGAVKLLGSRAPFDIMRGNHDMPMDGPAFFQFMNGIVENVRYVTEPLLADNGLWLLPFTPRPIEDWKGINFGSAKAAFLHATVTGAVSESGHQLTGGPLPVFPKHVKLYSGDVHNPQTIDRLTYVGCPHVIKFGDKFQPRMLLLDENTYEIVKIIPIETLSKRVIEISSIERLHRVKVNEGDQVRIKFDLANADVEGWGKIERQIEAWAECKGVILAPPEVNVERSSVSTTGFDDDPLIVLKQFGEEEGIDASLMGVGESILREVMG